MNGKLLTGIVIVFIGIIAAGAIVLDTEDVTYMTFPTIVFPLGVWLWFTWKVWRNGIDIFEPRGEPEEAEGYLRWMKIFIFIVGLSGMALSAGILWGVSVLGDEFDEGPGVYAIL